MRRLIFLTLAVLLAACIPIIASGDTAMTANYTAFATIPAPPIVPDADIGTTGPGTAMLTAIDIGVTMLAGTNYDVPVTYFCLRAKGSGHDAGVSLGSASALVEPYVSLNLDNTGFANYDATASPAATAGASGTRTFRRTILRC